MIALYGGAFDPPHVGHLFVVAYALAWDREIDTVVVVPTYRHPRKDVSTSFQHRAQMLRRMFDNFSNVTVDDTVELQIAEDKPDDEPVYTVEVAERYGSPLRLVMGDDEAATIHTWHRAKDLLDIVGKPIVAPRDIGISSTSIRGMFKLGWEEKLRCYVPPRVLAYIREKGLYVA